MSLESAATAVAGAGNVRCDVRGRPAGDDRLAQLLHGRIAPQQIQFVGEFEGIMYFEDGDGALNTALFVCPTVHELDQATEKTQASGNCHIVSAEGIVFGRFQCEGAIGYCDGQFEITAGTDALEGITGGGPMKIRTALTNTMRDAVSGSAVAEAAGLAIWPSLTVNIPQGEQ